MKSIRLRPPTDLDPALKSLWRHYFVSFRCLSLLPPALGYRLCERIARDKLRKEHDWAARMAEGVRRAFPEAPAAFAAATIQAYYRMAAREILDVFYLERLRPHHLGRALLPSGFDILRATPAGRGTVIAMAHFGRPIMLSTALGLSGFQIGMLSQPVDARNPDLNPVMQAYLQYKMGHTVSKAGGTWLTTLDNPRLLYDAMERGETIIVMLDVVMEAAKRHFKNGFLGGTLAIPTGTLRLLQKTGARLVYGAAVDRGRAVSTEIRALPEDPEAAMAAAIRELERDVLVYPWQWWQWGQLDRLWSSLE